jgi:hypothetical protein
LLIQILQILYQQSFSSKEKSLLDKIYVQMCPQYIDEIAKTARKEPDSKLRQYYTSRKWVFGPAFKRHLSRFGWPMGTNDRPRSRFVPPAGRSRFISEHRSRFVASTGTNAPPPAWHVALCGALVPIHATNRDQRPSPGYK